jgi:hypothetical protein
MTHISDASWITSDQRIGPRVLSDLFLSGLKD